MTDRAGIVRIGTLQTAPRFGEPAANLEAAAARIAGAPEFDVLVLPELFASGYLFRDREEARRLAEPVGGATGTALAEWAAERGAWIAGGWPEFDGDRVFNAAMLVGPDGTRHVYRKVHLFDRETEVFDPGNRPFEAWDVKTSAGAVRVGMMICFDWIFPEAMRSLAVDGAEVVLHPSNLVREPCQDAMRTRCLENRVWAATANRFGADDRGDLRLAFTGRSQIVDPGGDVVYRAAAEGEELAVREIDLTRSRDKRFTARNELMEDRRPETYRL